MNFRKIRWKVEKYLPIKFYAELNGSWFAAIEWKLYKWFGVKRKKSCGRFGHAADYLSCCQPIDKEHCYLSEDKRNAYCKCCNRVRILCSEPLDLDHLHETEW